MNSRLCLTSETNQLHKQSPTTGALNECYVRNHCTPCASKCLQEWTTTIAAAQVFEQGFEILGVFELFGLKFVFRPEWPFLFCHWGCFARSFSFFACVEVLALSGILKVVCLMVLFKPLHVFLNVLFMFFLEVVV